MCMEKHETEFVRKSRALKNLVREIERWDSDVRELPTGTTPSVAEVRSHIREAFPLEDGIPQDQLLDGVIDVLRRWTTHACSPRHFGLFVTGTQRSGVLADALAALYNPQLGSWWYAPAAAEIERLLLDRFMQLVGFGPQATAHFTSGGSEASLSAVVTATAHRLPETASHGVGSHAPTIYISDHAHDSAIKIAQITGLGRNAVRRIPVDARYRMDVAALRGRIDHDSREGRTPLMVIATAGTTGVGAIDPLPALASLCSQRGLWLHVDAAWGGLALLSSSASHHLDGISAADSVTWDAHKCLPVPTAAGMFLCRHGKAVRQAFDVTTRYVSDEVTGTEDAYRSTIQWSRRFIGLKVFMLVAELGWSGIQAMVDHQIAMGQLLRRMLRDRGWSLYNDSPLPVVCFNAPEIGEDPEAVEAAVETLIRRGRIWLSALQLDRRRTVFRACICNDRTDEGDLRILVDELESLRTDVTGCGSAPRRGPGRR